MTSKPIYTRLLRFSEFTSLTESDSKSERQAYAPMNLSGASRQEQIDYNKSHPLMSGHIHEYNNLKKTWAPSSRSMFGAENRYKFVDGKYEMSPHTDDNIKTEHISIGTNGTDHTFGLSHTIPGTNKKLIFTQHFMARAHGYNENGSPLPNGNRNEPTAKHWNEIISVIAKNIKKQGITASTHPTGLVAHVKKHNIYIPISTNKYGDISEFTLRTHLPKGKPFDQKVGVVMESTIEVEFLQPWFTISD